MKASSSFIFANEKVSLSLKQTNDTIKNRIIVVDDARPATMPKAGIITINMLSKFLIYKQSLANIS